MVRLIRNYVDERFLGDSERPYYSCSGVAHVVDEYGEVERIQGAMRVEIPMSRWVGDENETLIEALRVGAESKVVRAQSVSSLGPTFWTQLRGHMEAFVAHPSLEGSFIAPDHTELFYSAQVPASRLLCLSKSSGTLMVQGGLLGFILPDSARVLAVHFYQ